MNHSLNWALKKTSRELCVDYDTVLMVYRSYWGFIRNTIESLPLKTMTQEEVSNTKTNFNIPYIGKFYVKYDKINKYKRQLKYYQDVKAKENKANRNTDSGD